MAYEVIDNFLDISDFFKLKNTIIDNPEFPWGYYPSKTHSDFSQIVGYEGNELYNQQFVHVFYSNFEVISPQFNCLVPLINKINPSAIKRIKMNLTTRTDEIVKYGYHTDFTNDNLKTAVYYLNTNNGYTEFENGDKVESVANRIVIFDSYMSHTGTSCTDAKARVLINLNFYI